MFKVGRGFWWQAEGQAYGRIKIEAQDEDRWEHEVDAGDVEAIWHDRFLRRLGPPVSSGERRPSG
jgi:hypothetical protein